MKQFLKIIGIFALILLVMSKKIRAAAAAVTGIGFESPYKSSFASGIYRSAISRGVHPDLAKLMVAWSRHETGDFKSHFVKDFNSYFGYSNDKNSKYQTHKGSKADNGVGIASYASPADSVLEVIDYMKRRDIKDDRGVWPPLQDITTPEMLVGLLFHSRYFGTGKQKEHDLYLKSVRHYFENPD